MNDLDSQLGTALRDRVAHVHPDLDQLVAASVRAGTRIRMRRRVGVSLLAAAGVAVVAVGGVQMAGGGTQAVDGGVGLAAEPSPSPSVSRAAALPAVGDRITLPSGAVATVLDPTGSIEPDDDPRPVLLLQTEKSLRPSDGAHLAKAYPGVRLVGHVLHPGHLAHTPPIQVDAGGWQCEWFVADDKGTCSGGGAMVSVNWRPASEHASFMNAAKADLPGAKAHTYVGEVHGDLFATVQPMTPATSQAAIDDVAAALAWK